MICMFTKEFSLTLSLPAAAASSQIISNTKCGPVPNKSIQFALTLTPVLILLMAAIIVTVRIFAL